MGTGATERDHSLSHLVVSSLIHVVLDADGLRRGNGLS